MYVPSPVDPFENVRNQAAQRQSRAGLRVAPANAGPTGAFVVIEMVVLVVVAALAMVSIIVSSIEGVDRGGVVEAPRAEHAAVRDDGPSSRLVAPVRPVEVRRPAPELGAR